MDNFDFKKYLAKNPLNEAYTPGSGWTKDFDYDDMLAQGLEVSVDTPIEDLEKMFADFEDVNYHREGEPLSYAIDALKDGNKEEAEDYINKFHAEVKKTIADYSDEYFDVNEAQGDKFDVETTTKIAQKVADAFTADDSDGLDLKYVVSPDVEESSFNLDVEAGPNTPGEDWKDANGFSIDNYLGKYAGGSFYIKDGVVVNAAMRSAKVANVSPEGEVEMISAEDSKADLDAREKANVFVREETKSNKMKKSELKEMIKAAMLAEYEKDVNVTDENPENEEDFLAETQNSEVLAMADMIMDALGAEKFVDELISAMDTDEAKANLEHIIQMWDLDGGLREAEEEVDTEVEADVDVDVDAEEGGEEVAASEEEEIDVKEKAKVDPNVKAVQDALTIAQAAAAELGDAKLTDQIGNTITFFTRAHVASVDKGAMAEELNVNEITFPMWTKLKK
jgi:hypothetical protein